MRTEVGDVRVAVPRDRNGTFDPVTVPTGQRRLSGLDKMVLSLYANGVTTGDIASFLEENLKLPSIRRSGLRGLRISTRGCRELVGGRNGGLRPFAQTAGVGRGALGQPQ